MKEYESYSNLKVFKDLPLIIRLDGRSFSNYTKNLNLKKPFDKRLNNIFIDVAKDLINEFNIKFIYTFSDELNLLFEDIPFNRRVEKIDSIFASYTTGSFLKHLLEYDDFKKLDLDIPSFDSRVITTTKINEYFINRQNEAWRNCLNGYAQHILRKNHTPKEVASILYKMKKSEIHDLLFKNNINASKIAIWQKRGICLYKIQKEFIGYNPHNNVENISYKNEIVINCDMKLFKDYNVSNYYKH